MNINFKQQRSSVIDFFVVHNIANILKCKKITNIYVTKFLSLNNTLNDLRFAPSYFFWLCKNTKRDMILSHENEAANRTFVPTDKLVGSFQNGQSLRQNLSQDKKSSNEAEALDAGHGHRRLTLAAFRRGRVHLLGDVVGKLKAVAFETLFQTLQGRSVNVAKQDPAG